MNRSDLVIKAANKYPSEVLADEITKHPSPFDLLHPIKEANSATSLTLPQLLDEFGPFPTQTAVFGLCEDNLPILLDFSDPVSGSIIIESPPDSGKTSLLKSILWSLVKINQPGEVSFILIAPENQRMDSLSRQPHCIKSFSPYQRESSEYIVRLCSSAEQRRSGRGRGPAIVLAIDDLAYLASDQMDGDVMVYFEWLIKAGPMSQIFTIATVNHVDLKTIDSRITSSFKSKINGITMGMLPKSRGFPAINSSWFRNQFSLKLRNEYVRFAVPYISN
jgi:Cdc6-like AAA superfamily ATPase